MLMEPESKKVIETVEQKMKREKRLLNKVERKNVSNCFFSGESFRRGCIKNFCSKQPTADQKKVFYLLMQIKTEMFSIIQEYDLEAFRH